MNVNLFTCCELLSKFVTLHSQYNAKRDDYLRNEVVNCFQNL